MSGAYKRVGGGGVVGGRVGSWRRVIPSIGTEAVVLCPQQVTRTDIIHRVGHWQQLAPHASLLKPHSGPTGPVVHPCRLTGLAKSPT